MFSVVGVVLLARAIGRLFFLALGNTLPRNLFYLDH